MSSWYAFFYYLGDTEYVGNNFGNVKTFNLYLLMKIQVSDLLDTKDSDFIIMTVSVCSGSKQIELEA